MGQLLGSFGATLDSCWLPVAPFGQPLESPWATLAVFWAGPGSGGEKVWFRVDETIIWHTLKFEPYQHPPEI